jgi:hypothetical protein
MASAKALSDAVLQASEIQSMKQEQRVDLFVQRDKVMRRAFSELGKLLSIIARHVPRGETVEQVLAAAGVHRSTVSNARIASKAFDLIEAGALTEAKYDTLTFEECRAIGKVKSMDTLKTILKAKNYRQELESISDNGCTIAEHAKNVADKAALIGKAAAEAASEAAPAATDDAPAPAEANTEADKPTDSKTPDNVVKLPAASGITQQDLLTTAMSYVSGLREVLPRLTDATPVMDALRAIVEGKPAKAKKAA